MLIRVAYVQQKCMPMQTVMRSVASVCPSLDLSVNACVPDRALTFESFDLETSLLVYLSQVCISRSSGQGQGHWSKTGYTSVTYAGGQPSNKPLKCSGYILVTFKSVQCHPGLTYIFNF